MKFSRDLSGISCFRQTSSPYTLRRFKVCGEIALASDPDSSSNRRLRRPLSSAVWREDWELLDDTRPRVEDNDGDRSVGAWLTPGDWMPARAVLNFFKTLMSWCCQKSDQCANKIKQKSHILNHKSIQQENTFVDYLIACTTVFNWQIVKSKQERHKIKVQSSEIQVSLFERSRLLGA